MNGLKRLLRFTALIYTSLIMYPEKCHLENDRVALCICILIKFMFQYFHELSVTESENSLKT
ncbi:hypothetical protein CDG60_14125 [Acinetobacter chinensis]|uniref:Uncharacterized protein n=1 Tax=Acinetobacter chinensis TaxID=2004650 RepID=A0A3B7M1G5_9GAMM|nr:hypothetical protein CDG60_14125 [Acinetobacter chinensis]